MKKRKKREKNEKAPNAAGVQREKYISPRIGEYTIVSFNQPDNKALEIYISNL